MFSLGYQLSQDISFFQFLKVSHRKFEKHPGQFDSYGYLPEGRTIDNLRKGHTTTEGLSQKWSRCQS